MIRGVTQLARRLKTYSSPSRGWMLRATHSSDETRFPPDKKRPEPTTARCLARGVPEVDGSFDFWPGAKAELRPNASCPDGEPQAEPSMTAKIPVVLKKRRSAHVKKSQSVGEYHFPPSCATDRLGGTDTPAPPYPLCDLGLEGEEADKVRRRPGSKNWWDAEFQLGRAPFDSKNCAIRHALFESFASAGRALAPVFRFLIRSRGAQLRGESVPDPKEVRQAAFDILS